MLRSVGTVPVLSLRFILFINGLPNVSHWISDMNVLLMWVTAKGEELLMNLGKIEPICIYVFIAYMLFTAAFILLIKMLATQDFYSMITKMLDEFPIIDFTLIG